MAIKGEKRCPRCHVSFNQRKGENCPNCGVGLKFQRGYKDGVYQFWYEPFGEGMAKPLPTETQPLPQSTAGLYPKTHSSPGEDPQVIEVSPNKYQVTYQVVMYNMTAYCPKCHKPSFQMSMLRGDLDHFCNESARDGSGKCLAVTKFIFLSSHLPQM